MRIVGLVGAEPLQLPGRGSEQNLRSFSSIRILFFVPPIPQYPFALLSTNATETKTLKKLVRDIIDPSRDLGHVDGKKSTTTITAPAQAGLDRREDAGNGEHGVTGHDADTGETGEVGEEKHRKEEDKGDAKRQEGGKVEGQGKAACEDCGWIGGIIPDTFSL